MGSKILRRKRPYICRAGVHEELKEELRKAEQKDVIKIKVKGNGEKKQKKMECKDSSSGGLY